MSPVSSPSNSSEVAPSINRIFDNCERSRPFRRRKVSPRAQSIAALLTLSLVLLLALTGCTTKAPLPVSASPSGSAIAQSAAQKQELADGKVTYAEYEAAFRRYVACDAKAGYKLSINGQTNEVNNFSVPAAAVDSGIDEKCNKREFDDVDTKWQIGREDTSPQAQAYSKCLLKAGITPKATETEKFDQLEKAHIDPTKCYLSDGDNG
jgi:hypothetical protein